jgi:anti-sigma B factor antagonist
MIILGTHSDECLSRRLTVPTEPQPQQPVLTAVATGDGPVLVEMSGDLDITTVPVLANQLAGLADMRPTELFIDMSGVRFLDCASARLLAGTAALLPPGRRPVLTSVSPTVRRLLELTGLAGIMQIAD